MRFYVECAHAKKAGVTHGGWVAADGCIESQVKEILRSSPFPTEIDDDGHPTSDSLVVTQSDFHDLDAAIFPDTIDDLVEMVEEFSDLNEDDAELFARFLYETSSAWDSSFIGYYREAYRGSYDDIESYAAEALASGDMWWIELNKKVHVFEG
jgi:hypothetical protein